MTAGYAAYELVFVFEQRRQRLDARLQTRVLRLHLSTQTRHHRHGRVERVLVDLRAVLANECEHATQTARVEHGARFARADELQHLQSKATITIYPHNLQSYSATHFDALLC